MIPKSLASLLMLFIVPASAAVSYVCDPTKKDKNSIHLSFSEKAPTTVGFARVNPKGVELSSGKLSCLADSKTSLKCADILVKGSYSTGENLELTEGNLRYNCKARTEINLNAVKSSL